MESEIRGHHRHIWGFWIPIGLMLAVPVLAESRSGIGPGLLVAPVLLIFQLGTERIAARLPRRGAPELGARWIGLAVALVVAGGVFWGQMAWFDSIYETDPAADIEIGDGDLLNQNALLLILVYALVVLVALARRARRASEAAPGDGPAGWRPLPQLLDVVVIGVALTLLFADGDLILNWGGSRLSTWLGSAAAIQVLGYAGAVIVGAVLLAGGRIPDRPRAPGTTRFGEPAGLLFAVLAVVLMAGGYGEVVFWDRVAMPLMVAFVAFLAVGYHAAAEALTERTGLSAGVAARGLGLVAAYLTAGLNVDLMTAALTFLAYGSVVLVALAVAAAVTPARNGVRYAPLAATDLLLLGLAQAGGVIHGWQREIAMFGEPDEEPLEYVLRTAVIALAGAAFLFWHWRRRAEARPPAEG